MPNVQPDFPPCFGVNLPWTLAAHLASESVSVKNFSAEFGGNWASEADGSFVGRRLRQDVLPWL